MFKRVSIETKREVLEEDESVTIIFIPSLITKNS